MYSSETELPGLPGRPRKSQGDRLIEQNKEEPRRLRDFSKDLENILLGIGDVPSRFSSEEIKLETHMVPMRDEIRLATDVYLPPTVRAPGVAMRTPYGRALHAKTFLEFAKRGYVVISQDCRGTGDSEPDNFDFYVYELEDSIDFVEWVSRQKWFNGFLGSCGGSYVAETQFAMAMHPRMSAIAPEVGGLGISSYSVHFYMFLNAFSRSVGKGSEKIPVPFEVLERQILEETLRGGYYNEPLIRPISKAILDRYPNLRDISPFAAKRWLWESYSMMPSKGRAEMVRFALGRKGAITIEDIELMSEVFGHDICVDAHMFPRIRNSALVRSLQAPSLFITGWYDWFLDDVFATWDLLMREGPESLGENSRLIITPSAHNRPGYYVGAKDNPELSRVYRLENNLALLLKWYASVREETISQWPKVIYYLMGANCWYTASTWPPAGAKSLNLYLGPSNTLLPSPPAQDSHPDCYTYDPDNPTPTIGGSIVSYVYTPGSADVTEVQKRPDVLVYTTDQLERDLDIVGPLRLALYGSSSAVDTDFSARLSDVGPDGRAIQLQSRMLRARYREAHGEPSLLEPGRIYRFEIDMCATANRFKAGHSLRLDISSSDFPKFDRNSNRGGTQGSPIPAMQTIYHDPAHPSKLVLFHL